MIKFDIVTLFPQLFEEYFNNLPYKRAIQKKLAEYNLWQLRNYAMDKHGTVDDKPYGGGTGMVLMPEPIYKAVSDIYHCNPATPDLLDKVKNTNKANSRIIVLSPKGRHFTQKDAKELSQTQQVTLICGRYEGIDARIEQHIATDIFSVGDFVLSGGEIPALAILEAVTRLVPGVLEKEEAVEIESFSHGKLEYPQYTRPEDFMGLKVPEILLSGHHQQIETWREKNSDLIEDTPPQRK